MSAGMETAASRMAWLQAVALDSRLGHIDARVALVLMTRFRNHETGQCNPRHEVLAEALGTGKRSIYGALNALKVAGWLTVIRKGQGHANQYDLDISRLGLAEHESQPAAGLTRYDSQSDAQSVAASCDSEQLESQSDARSVAASCDSHIEPDPEPLESTQEAFDVLWGMWRKKQCEDDAMAAFRKACRYASPQEIIAGARRYQVQVHNDPVRFDAKLHDWLRGKRWKDKPYPASPRDCRSTGSSMREAVLNVQPCQQEGSTFDLERNQWSTAQ